MHEIRKIHSDMIVLIIAVLSAYNIDNKIVHAQVSIETHGNIKAGNSIVLECKVTSFGNTGATWSQDNGITILTQCVPAGICTDTGSGNYQYTSDSNGINVTISLTAIELGKTWTCTHASFVSSKTVSTSPTETTKMLSTSTSIDQITSSQNPFTDTSHTQKIETILTTTDKGLTSASWYGTSEVTTLVNTESDNNKKLTFDEIKAIAIPSVILFPVLIGFFVICCLRHHRRKCIRKHTSQRFQQKQSKRNEKSNHKVPEFRQNSSANRYGMKENSGLSTRVEHDCNQHSRKYGREYSIPSMSHPSEYGKFQHLKQHRTVNRNEKYGTNTTSSQVTHDNNQHTRGHNWRQHMQSPERLESLECNFTRNKNEFSRRDAPYMLYVHEHYDPKKIFIYQGPNRVQERQFRQLHWY